VATRFPPIETGHTTPDGAAIGAPLPDSSIEQPVTRNGTGRTVVLGTLIGVTYVAAAQLGFRVAFLAEQVTTVWAPTGIALAALLLWGVRLWPVIWVAAFVVNAGTNAPLWTALVIATGNTLEAVAAAWVLRRLPGFDPGLRRVGSVLAFVCIGGMLSTMLSATVGVGTLCAAAVQPWARYPALWLAWWLGDALGALVVAPAILTAVHRVSWSRRDAIHAAIFVGAAVVVTHIVFGQVLGFSAHPVEYVVFPLVIAAAVTGGPAITAMVVLGASAVTISHTVHGVGPFASAEVHESLILLQAFTGVLAGTALLLAAAIAERETSERRARHAAEVVRHREQMLRLAQHAGGVATFEWDFRNQLAQCSSEFFQIFGLPPRDGVMAAAEWGRFVHPDDRDRMASHLERALAGAEAPAADYRIVAADGATRWLSYAGQVQKTADGDRLLGTVLDITERKRLEAELRHHAAEVERILESIGEGFLALDREFRYTYINQAAEEMLGRSRSELIGRAPWEVFPAETARESMRQLELVMASGAGGRYDVHVPERNRWYENRVYPSPTGLSIFFADVTARMETESARKRSEMALQQAKEAAESANQLKDQFLATLSHELRTPLNAILGYARMLQTKSIAPEKRERAIDVIERNAVAQHQLVEDLLDMSRITTGKIRLDPAPVPVAAVLREAVEGVKPAADAKRIVLEMDLDPFAGTVTADATRLQQVFWNVLTNAVKFTAQGGRVLASLRRDGTAVEIAVTDTGMGIPPDFVPFVFDPFRQADARLSRGQGGLGLGLAISRQLVELHGGTIAASSDGVGHGATFVIRLPRLSGDDASSFEGAPVRGD
jgi:PAS domain S-box-containing protein